MAKSPKVVGVNMKLLSAIVMAEAAGQMYFVAKNPESVALVEHNPPLILVDTATADPSDPAKVAAKPTDAGKVMVANANAAPATPTAQSTFAILTGVELPQSKPRGGGAGAPSKYPFEQMEIGQSFFVPGADAVKKLQSTVSSANLRFAEVVGEKTVERTKRGPGNKAVLDTNGNKVKETVTIPQHKLTRRFTIRPVEAGKVYGSWTAPETGAVIARVALKAE